MNGVEPFCFLDLTFDTLVARFALRWPYVFNSKQFRKVVSTSGQGCSSKLFDGLVLESNWSLSNSFLVLELRILDHFQLKNLKKLLKLRLVFPKSLKISFKDGPFASTAFTAVPKPKPTWENVVMCFLLEQTSRVGWVRVRGGVWFAFVPRSIVTNW